jgi:GNAT superfamily N-acetyltransferase
MIGQAAAAGGLIARCCANGNEVPMRTIPALEFHPLSAERWDDFARLFGARGAYGGCWCMWWRIPRKEFEQQQGEGNRAAMQQIVESGEIPGILGYAAGEPAAWCSIAPRERFAALNRSRVMKPLDDLPVWSLVCLFVAKRYRGAGITVPLIEAAVDYARQQGGRIVEAYPTVPQDGPLAPVSSFMGVPSVFQRAGFVECARPSRSRMIMRRYLE